VGLPNPIVEASRALARAFGLKEDTISAEVASRLKTSVVGAHLAMMRPVFEFAPRLVELEARREIRHEAAVRGLAGIQNVQRFISLYPDRVADRLTRFARAELQRTRPVRLTDRGRGLRRTSIAELTERGRASE